MGNGSTDPAGSSMADRTVSLNAVMETLRNCSRKNCVIMVDGRLFVDYDQVLEELKSLPPAQPAAGKPRKNRIVFRLSMPGKGSWNGRWSGENRTYAKVKAESDVPRILWGRSFYYRWPDGWTVCVSVEPVTATEARKVQKASDGFCGYDWMIPSILKYGAIIDPSDGETPEAEALRKAFEESAAKK